MTEQASLTELQFRASFGVSGCGQIKTEHRNFDLMENEKSPIKPWTWKWVPYRGYSHSEVVAEASIAYAVPDVMVQADSIELSGIGQSVPPEHAYGIRVAPLLIGIHFKDILETLNDSPSFKANHERTLPEVIEGWRGVMEKLKNGEVS